MLRRVREIAMAVLLLPMCVAGHATPPASYPTAKVTVNGTEQSIGGSWDNGNITIDFNGYLETVHYGQFSSDASLASALAAMFTRDYISFGLYAKAGANSNTDPTVITFQLVNGSSFGAFNVTGPSTSFTFTPTGFTSTPPGVPDQGVATLLFNGAAIATASYGDGSTPASIARDLALKASSSFLVTVTADGSSVYLQSKQTGTYSDTYSLSFSTSLSFSSSPGGTLSGTSEAAPISVYSYSLGYDAVGNVTTLNDSVMGNWSYANGYDKLNRLVSGQASTGPYAGQYLCWSYDNFGNRTNQSISNQAFVTTGSPCQAVTGASLTATVLSYGTNNQISSVTSPALTVAYDGGGNVKNDGNNSYLYDAEGRICALKGPQGMFGYQYDAAGNRVGRGTITSMSSCDVTQNGYQPASDYVLDLSGNQMTEISVGNGQSIWQHTNVTADGTLIATYDTTGLHFYVNDALGSRRVQTDPAGFPEQTCQNLAFGDQLYCTASLNSPTEHHFTGKERDTESGLDYFGARYYGSNMGRWMSPDWADKPEAVPYSSLGDPQSLNLYSYVGNNPLSKADADGHCWPVCTTWFWQSVNVLQKASNAIGNGIVSFLNQGAAAISDPTGRSQAVMAMGMLANSVVPVPEFGGEINVGASAPAAIETEGAALTTEIPQIQLNAAQGAAWEDTVGASLRQVDPGTVQNVTLQTQSGTRTVMDFVGKDANGSISLTEAKSSATARLTPNQAAAHPEIANTGATVMGKGKPGYPGGTQIPPTNVNVVRPPQQ